MNPFTRETFVSQPLGMVDAEIEAARAILTRNQVELDKDGYGILSVPGGTVEICQFNDSGCFLKVRASLVAVGRFAFNLATAGNMTIFADRPLIVTTTAVAFERAQEIAKGELDEEGNAPPVVRVRDASQLVAAFADEFAEAQEFFAGALRGD